MDIALDNINLALARVQIAILGKAPIPGTAKTRLIPTLGPRGAARLQRQMTRITLQTAFDAQLGSVTLWCAPDAGHRLFQGVTTDDIGKLFGVTQR